MSKSFLRILQITDFHVADSPEAEVMGVRTHASLRATLADARARAWPPDLILATGDLSETASPASYRLIRAELAGLGVRVHCLPGNHDRAGALARHLAGGPIKCSGALDAQGWRIVTLDSTVPGRPGGRLSSARLAALDRALEAAGARPVLVGLHHPPVSIGSPWMDAMGLAHAPAFFAVLDRHPTVRGVVWGHIHQPFESARRGVRLIGSPSTCRQFRPRTQTPVVADDPPAWRRLDLYADGRIETRLGWVEAMRAPPS